MNNENSNGEPIKKPRAAKKFEARFDKLSQAIKTVDESQIDDVFADLVILMTSSEEDCVFFLRNCTLEQAKTARLVLDQVANSFPTGPFLRAVKCLQRRFPQFDFTTCLDAVACGIAEKGRAALLKKKPGVPIAKVLEELRAKAEAGNPVSQFKLALRYYYGTDVERDYDAARQWAQRAIDQGYMPATIFLDLPRD